ncbi:hypothetical protein PVAP13_8KG243800 [Panicum virgatum]|uniref:Uncharacterized protein n=1 Tax=Panicum virgatum TaxID=38727 RepID=A0A8T0PUY6_PANVG|nr:hypothetical protein PVAP13_8KG243800 [Panicum virgatum]
MRAPLHCWWTHRSNSNLDVWLVGCIRFFSLG